MDKALLWRKKESKLVSKLNGNEIQIMHLKFDNDKDLKKLENNIIKKKRK